LTIIARTPSHGESAVLRRSSAMIRAATATFVAALGLVLLNACGQASAPPSLSAPPGTDPSSHVSRHAYGRLTKPQAAAFASAVNIRLEDTPGFREAKSVPQKGSKPQKSPKEQRLERAMLTCTGIMNGHSELAQLGSKEFEYIEHGNQLGVSSSVSVAKTPAIAVRGLTGARSSNARTCLAHSLAQDVERNPNGGSSIRTLSASPEKALAPGTSGGVVLRVLASVLFGGKSYPLSLNYYGFVCGQTEIGLFTTSLPGAFPTKVRQQLLSLLLARARAQGQCRGGHTTTRTAAF
jgi:hypothetical protein